jgi:hypothetical protein
VTAQSEIPSPRKADQLLDTGVVSHCEEMIRCLHYTRIARPVVKAYVIFRKERLYSQTLHIQTNKQTNKQTKNHTNKQTNKVAFKLALV